ncbi:NHL repeat-containing protein [Streptomyces sp. HU2014]|uniref:NHL repeat-containing protein n=1 Tax=Streptomyces sp. HU2014 TaxID=2939414 RepID=UPI00200FE310|nr:NHL repeat-containing protein [Streptomyces sp. HU2014]UQI44822.1 NHL repeat-containing protein [Streptomyces sp. HU2014]
MSEPSGTERPPAPAPAGEPLLSTVAGNGDADYTGDGKSATTTALHRPSAVAADASGNLYIADSKNHRVRRVDAGTGIVTTVAGTGEDGFAGDYGPAAKALLNRPDGVAVDSAGHLYIADTDNHRIRKVDAHSRTITTVAGIGKAYFSGDEGPATEAYLNNPRGVAVDSLGNLYIADSNNERVRRVDARTGIITTVAGTYGYGTPGDGGSAVDAHLYGPYGVAVDFAGNLYIADTYHHLVRKVDARTRIITTVAGNGEPGFTGDGPAVKNSLYHPRGVAVDAAGNLYIADTDDHRIRRVDAATRIMTTVAGNGKTGFTGDGEPATETPLYSPFGVALDSAGNVYIADTENHRVRKVGGASVVVRYSVLPVEWPDVVLTHGGETGYPGVRLLAEDDGRPAPQKVSVTLPEGKGLEFVAQGEPGYQLTVQDPHGRTTFFDGTLNGRTLTFEDVDLALSGKGSESRAWVAVKAAAGAPLGDTTLGFQVGDRYSPSTAVHVVPRFALSPSDSEPRLTRAGETGFVGVDVRAVEGGTVPPQTVRVTLPAGAGLRFVPGHDGICQVTVMDADMHTTSYDGTLSPDGRTLTVEGVGLALAGKGSRSGAWVAVKASPDAPSGESRLDFQVGGRTSPTGTVRVLDAAAKTG